MRIQRKSCLISTKLTGALKKESSWWESIQSGPTYICPQVIIAKQCMIVEPPNNAANESWEKLGCSRRQWYLYTPVIFVPVGHVKQHFDCPQVVRLSTLMEGLGQESTCTTSWPSWTMSPQSCSILSPGSSLEWFKTKQPYRYLLELAVIVYAFCGTIYHQE